MHPDIKKFWQNTGNEVVGPTLIDSYEMYIGKGFIRIIETIYHAGKYRFNKKWYSEEEMLKIIRQKAFI